MIPRTAAVPAWRLYLRCVLAACVGLTSALALAGEACAQPASFGQVVERPIPGDPVMIDSGQIAGKLLPTGVKAYFGVPFAAAPVQQLRWREPQPVPSWRGVLQADRFAPECIQALRAHNINNYFGEEATSEDCLYLNIWAPTKAAGKPLAVLVWFHGGGFSNGSASMPLYWGDRLAAKGVIVVTVAYRLGPFGFLAHPELTLESPDRTSGNYGLMDQIAALKWVKRNIGAFGGDPDQVTIAGQSAGAMSVSLLMASPLAKGLFQRAIGQSGGVFEPFQLAPGWLLANAEKEGLAYAASLGARSLAELRALPAATLLTGKAAMITHPVMEPHLLPAAPYDVFAAGRQNDVPVLIGSNEEEARSLADLAPVTAASFRSELEKHWGSLPAPIVAAYPYSTDDQARKARVDLERDLRFGWDMWAWARLQSGVGKSPVYAYHFTQNPPFPARSVRAGWGASHYAELWYMFDHLGQEPWAWTASDHALAGAMSGYWVNFVKSGNPNGPGLPPWPAYTSAGEETLYLGSPIEVGPTANLRTLRVFDAVYARVRGTPGDRAN